MSIGLYLFITFLFVMIYLINKEDKKQEKVKKLKKPNLEKIHQMSTSEVRQMYRDSLDELKGEINE